MKTKPKGASILLRHLPRDLRDAFKAHCLANGMTMQGQLTKLIRDFVKTSPIHKGPPQ